MRPTSPPEISISPTATQAVEAVQEIPPIVTTIPLEGYANGPLTLQLPLERVSAKAYWSAPSGLTFGASLPIATHEVVLTHETPMSGA